MNILIVLAHPDQNSFNHAIANRCKSVLEQIGHKVIFSDLHKDNFPPLLEVDEIPSDAIVDETINKYCKELSSADGIIIVHPNWWGQPPAILKGWIDRVIRPEIAYRFEEGDSGEGVPIGLLKAKAAIVFNTANTSEERENKLFKDPLETIWKNCIFDLCGVKQFERKMFRIIVTSTNKERENWLKEVEKTVNNYFPKSF